MVVPVELARQLVALHRLALARLLGEIGVAFDASLARWFRVFPDPMQIQGGTLCQDVRSHVLAMNGIDAQSTKAPTPRLAPEGASCGPGSTLRMSTGPSSSVRIGDAGMAWARVRHISPQRAADIGALPPQSMPQSKPGKQMALDAGEPEDQRVFGPAGIGDDQASALADALLHARGEDRMPVGRVGADDHHHIGGFRQLRVTLDLIDTPETR